MNLVFNPETGKLERKWVHSGSTFAEVDDALYHHERAFYAYCAKGAGSNPDEDLDWRRERARLTALWHDKCTYKADVDPCSVRGTSIVRRFFNLFKASA